MEVAADVDDACDPGSGQDAGSGSVAARVDRALAGRDRELADLIAAVAAIDGGHGAVVAVTGPAGIGKSALVGAYVTRVPDGSALARAQCHGFATDEPLWPWGQLLDRLAKLATPEAMVGLDSIVELAPSLAAEARSRPQRSVEPASLFRPVVELLRRLADDRPLVLVIEDLQLADRATIELLSFASAALSAEPIAFVLTWREGSGPRSLSLRSLAGLPSVHRIELGPLERHAMEQLVGRAGLGGEVVDRLLSDTAGHPGYAIDLLAGLTRGSGPPPSGGASPSPPWPAGASRAVTDRVLASLDELDPFAARVLAAAAAHGDGFLPEVLAEVTDRSEVEVERVLDRARAAGIVVEASDLPPAYRFVQPVVAAALLADQGQPRLARLHAAIGHALWRRGRPALELARHFARTGSAGSLVLAARFAVDAAAGLVAIDDLADIGEIVDRALAAVDDDPGTLTLHVELKVFAAQLAAIEGRADRWLSLLTDLDELGERWLAAAPTATAATATTTPVGTSPASARTPMPKHATASPPLGARSGLPGRSRRCRPVGARSGTDASSALIVDDDHPSVRGGAGRRST